MRRMALLPHPARQRACAPRLAAGTQGAAGARRTLGGARGPGVHRALSQARWVLLAALAGSALSACAPTLDWRQMKPEGWTINLAMPCRPSEVTRSVPLAGAPVRMAMLSCTVQDHLFAVAAADMVDPARVGPALRALGEAARSNLTAQVQAQSPAQVPGMTPQAEARLWRLQGVRPDGQAVRMQVLVFAHGTRVYQATVLGPAADDALARPLFDGLGIRP